MPKNPILRMPKYTILRMPKCLTLRSCKYLTMRSDFPNADNTSLDSSLLTVSILVRFN